MRVPTRDIEDSNNARNHEGETSSSGNITADELDGHRLLQLQNSDHKAVLLSALDVLLERKWSPREPRLHGKTADVRILLLSVVLDVVDLEVLVVLVCSMNGMLAWLE